MQCDLVSGFVRFQWQLAIAAPTRMPTKTAITVVGPQPVFWQRQGSTARPRLLKIRPREGSVAREGCVKSRRVLYQAFARSNKNPHESSITPSEAISIRWRPIFPSGPFPETFRDFSITLVTTKIDRESRVGVLRGYS